MKAPDWQTARQIALTNTAMANGGNMNSALLAFIAAAMLAGCASADLQKTGATSGDYQADMRSCESLAWKDLPPGDPSMSDAVSIEAEQAMRRRQSAIACMKSKGWK